MAARATAALADMAIEVTFCAEHTRGQNVTALSAPRAPNAMTDTVRLVADGFMADPSARTVPRVIECAR